MKTQEQLQKMTEQALTFELACLVFGDDNVYMANFGKVSVSTNVDVGYVSINDWSWIMPLAIANGVGLVSGLNHFNAFCGDDLEIDVYAGSPQRAIAICLILKLQEIQE